ncbi:hypothetical protein HaLaN_22138 [Haematococcus lacustris]|uniref:Uncharacterized protein n=1 Tax=Haematococcus lacustris TaxID=44745 RepID=A0A699ZXJ4_HAELA|nr:hypothetical protein HaLaN_22138 [Haematococcus lacustris]
MAYTWHTHGHGRLPPAVAAAVAVAKAAAAVGCLSARATPHSVNVLVCLGVPCGVQGHQGVPGQALAALVVGLLYHGPSRWLDTHDDTPLPCLALCRAASGQDNKPCYPSQLLKSQLSKLPYKPSPYP